MSFNFTIGIKPNTNLSNFSKLGVKKIYCGYLEKMAIKKWPESFCTLNRRGESASFYGKRNFSKIAKQAENLGISIYVTFNGLYTPEQYSWIMHAINTVSSFQAVKGIIVNDIGLLLRLKTNKYTKEIVLSTGGTTFNSSTVSFYKQFNVTRIVLDRQLKLNELKDIIAAHTDLKFEIFLMFGNCLFIDGFCSLMHSLENRKKNKHNFFNISGLLSNCGFIHKLQSENKYQIIQKTGKKHTIKYNKQMRNLSTGCNLCALQELKCFSNNIIYKIVSRGNIFINELDIIKPFLTELLELGKNEYNKNILFKKIFQYDCNFYGCYASKKII
ncbi:MAG: U32 family peptidase [Endomicrobiaceae bacterium]|nr:U32 family peptidase [Endomicrobiaceae bacterium]